MAFRDLSGASFPFSSLPDTKPMLLRIRHTYT
nr:MAG TPA: hypothetical protein [Caudoviricetes sp.]